MLGNQMNSLTEEQVAMLKNMGALGYQPSKIASIMELPFSFVSTEMENPDSIFFRIYRAGQDRANYLIDLKLFDMAQSGDIKAMDKLSERKKAMKYEESKLR